MFPELLLFKSLHSRIVSHVYITLPTELVLLISFPLTFLPRLSCNVVLFFPYHEVFSSLKPCPANLEKREKKSVLFVWYVR